MSDTMHNEPAPTLADIWRLFQETDRKFKESDRKFQESERLFREMREQDREQDRQRAEENERLYRQRAEENERLFREMREQTRQRAEENERLFREMREQSQETDLQIKATSKKIGELGNRLGEFVEGMIKPAVLRLFQERGIAVHKVTRDVDANNPELGLAMQVDLLAINNDSCVLIEVKSNLGLDDVNEHLQRMEKFKPLFPEYGDKHVFGAVAGMVIADNVARYAYRKGFFVIGQKGDSAAILNDAKFQPTVW